MDTLPSGILYDTYFLRKRVKMNDTPNDYKSLYNQFRQDLKGQPL